MTPNKQTIHYLGLILLLVVFASDYIFAQADSSKSPLATDNNQVAIDKKVLINEFKEINDKLALLESKAFMPTILPVIMKNKEILGLTEGQLKHFIEWRKTNKKLIFSKMTKVVKKHITFKKAALDPSFSGQDLLQLQNEIFTLQRDVLELKLKCRNHVAKTFTDEQWDNFSFVISDHPELASFTN